MVVLYEKDETTFSDNGICVLDPSSCVVIETAGGDYELELEHPLDDQLRCDMLVEERLIKAPVPPITIPQTQLPALQGWKVVTETDLYSKTPTVTFKNKNWALISAVQANPSAYTWNANYYYNTGSVTLYGTNIFFASRPSMNTTPGANGFIWECIGTLFDTEPTFDAGAVLDHLEVNDVVFKIADKGGYTQVRTQADVVGFVPSACIVVSTETSPYSIPALTISEQIFRIYETSCDETSNTYCVKARHISYDYASNTLYDCRLNDATPQQAIAAIRGSLARDENIKILTNLSGVMTADWSFKNPVNALLDPDEGMVPKFKARLVRNNKEFYLLDYSNPPAGITLEYGVNLVGVNWTRSVENSITRIIPVSGSSDKGYLYINNGGRISNGQIINQGKNYVESEYADQFEVPRYYVLNCSYAVDQEIERPDGTKVKLDEGDVIWEMLDDAYDMFALEHVDGVDIQLDVEFVLLGDTEEYKQYRGLQKVSLYDAIKIKTGKSGIDAIATVTEYEYDCLRRRYNSIKLGTINTFQRRVAGYRLINNSITYEKLAPDLISRIVTANASASADSASPSGTPTGGSVTIVVPNTLNSDGVVLKGSGNANKVWKTDAYGNPAWRDESGGSAYTLPLAADGTRGGVQIGYTQSGKNYPVQLDGEKMYVNVPWTDHYAWSDITGKPNRAGSNTDGGDAINSDKLDGYHEDSFLRFRDTHTSSSRDTLWTQIGMSQYNNALPDGLADVYGYGLCVTLPTENARLEFYCPETGSTTHGLSYRSGWNNTKRTWQRLLDTNNYGNWAAKNTEAIKSISRSGTTFTATRCDGTTFTFTQQDNNTTYSANNGVGLSGTTFYNSGVRATSINGDYLRVNTNGTNADLTIAYATRAKNDGDSHEIKDSYGIRYKQTIDLTSQNVNTWYPVLWPIPYSGLHRIACAVQLNSETKPSWSSHNSGFTAVVELLVTASGWGTTNAHSILLTNQQLHIKDSTKPPVGYQQFTNSSNACFYLRGGGKYFLYASSFGTWTLYTSSKTISSQTVAPVTTYPGISLNRSKMIADLDGTATTANNAISTITRSGTTFTATRINGGTFTFTQQDNNTTYSAGTGLQLSGTKFSSYYAAKSWNPAINTTYCSSGSVNCYAIRLSSDRCLVTLSFDVQLKSTFSSDNVCRISDTIPTPWVGSASFPCFGTSVTYGKMGCIYAAGTYLKPWYCGNVSGHWYGCITYIALTSGIIW